MKLIQADPFPSLPMQQTQPRTACRHRLPWVLLHTIRALRNHLMSLDFSYGNSQNTWASSFQGASRAILTSCAPPSGESGRESG
jgi:hypothetical protein